MGHQSLETTMIYTHLMCRPSIAVTSPLDRLPAGFATTVGRDNAASRRCHRANGRRLDHPSLQLTLATTMPIRDDRGNVRWCEPCKRLWIDRSECRGRRFRRLADASRPIAILDRLDPAQDQLGVGLANGEGTHLPGVLSVRCGRRLASGACNAPFEQRAFRTAVRHTHPTRLGRLARSATCATTACQQ